MRAIATAVLFGAGLFGTAASAAPTDGRWAVRMVTGAGICDKSYDYVIAVEGGRVRYIPQDSDPAPSVSGQVTPAGAVSLDIRKGIARVAATGSLAGSAGAGSWKLGILCSGRWTAHKRGPVQAAR
jgi:hypothetical protein